MWEATAGTVLMLGALGVLAARSANASPRPMGAPLRAVAVVVGLLATSAQLPPLAATSSVRESQQAALRGDLDTALEEAGTAIDVMPWGATGWLQRALVLERLGDLERALAAVR